MTAHVQHAFSTPEITSCLWTHAERLHLFALEDYFDEQGEMLEGVDDRTSDLFYVCWYFVNYEISAGMALLTGNRYAEAMCQTPIHEIAQVLRLTETQVKELIPATEKILRLTAEGRSKSRA